MFLQCVLLPRRDEFQAKYRQANFALVSSLLVLVSLIIRNKGDHFLDASRDSRRLAEGVCWLAQVTAALTAFFAFGLIPRRPDVYSEGKLVDQQYTVSLFSKISFSWNFFVFDIARQRQLEMDDLPQLDSRTRSENLHRVFIARPTEGRLWWRLLKFFWTQLAQQWCLVLVSATLNVFPQYVMYYLLQQLEQPRTPESGISTTLVWALALCLSLALDNIVGSILYWWTNSQLVVPLNAVLQTLVFDKALKEHETAMPPPKQDEQDGDDKKDSKKNDTKAAEKPKKDEARQSVINHMKLDSGRVTMFCSFNYYLPLVIVKLVLAGGFLMTILGWKAVVAGLLAAALVAPVNSWMSKRYAALQL